MPEETQEKVKIADLDISDDDKAILSYCIKPRRAFDVAKKFKKHPSNVYNKLNYLVIMDWLVKRNPVSNRTYYALNQEKVIP